MSALTAEQFRDLCHEVRDLRASLDSCTEREAPAEAERLLRRVTELRAAKLKRANRRLTQLRDDVIYSAMLSHARRGGSGSEAAPTMKERIAHHLKHIDARHDVPGQLITDDQKRRAWSPAQRRAKAVELATEDAELDEFLANLTPEQRAEMERDINGGGS